jgi:hypothetical protein
MNQDKPLRLLYLILVFLIAPEPLETHTLTPTQTTCLPWI